MTAARQDGIASFPSLPGECLAHPPASAGRGRRRHHRMGGGQPLHGSPDGFDPVPISSMARRKEGAPIGTALAAPAGVLE